MSKGKTFSSVILWSVISAAFIGPGTVTTAASAGSLFGLDLLWAVTFATIACIILQEISGRFTIATGLGMGEALIRKFGEPKGNVLKFMIGIPVIVGCAAYEAGNILGAVSGLELMTDLDPKFLTCFITALATIFLWSGKRNVIGWLMTFLVGIMGVAFFVLALGTPFSIGQLSKSSLIPTLPGGSEILTLALVGTTIVPYNIFLGSGISKGQTIQLMRTGLIISVIIGGLITAAILVAGTVVRSFSSFDELGRALNENLGALGGISLGLGLFAAGLSSAITSPYAASVIASTVFGWKLRWQNATWIIVLITGLIFGISGVKPIPVILSVQALNGLILPLLTAYLIILINDPLLIPMEHRPKSFYNIIMILIFASVLFMGLNNIDKSVSTWMNIVPGHFVMMILATMGTVGLLCYKLIRSLA